MHMTGVLADYRKASVDTGWPFLSFLHKEQRKLALMNRDMKLDRVVESLFGLSLQCYTSGLGLRHAAVMNIYIRSI